MTMLPLILCTTHMDTDSPSGLPPVMNLCAKTVTTRDEKDSNKSAFRVEHPAH